MKPIKRIEEKFPALETLRQKYAGGIFCETEMEKAKSGAWTVRVRCGDDFRYVHSSYDPEKEAERLIGALAEEGKRQVFVFLGVGLGYSFRALMHRFPERQVLLWEPNEELAARFLDSVEWNEQTEKQVLFMGTSEEELLRCIFELKINQLQVSFVSSSFHEAVYQERIEYFLKIYREQMLFRSEFLVSGFRYSERELLSDMKNIPRMLKSPSVLHDERKRYADKPVLLIAAGPSLNDELTNLKRIYEEGTAYLIASGSSVHTLLKNDIVPHALVGIDAGLGVQKLVQPIKDGHYDEVSLFFGGNFGYEALADFPGQTFWMKSANEEIRKKFLKESPPVKEMPLYVTVANAALHLAIHFGFSPIVLVGQNFAYRNGETYAKDISYYEQKRLLKNGQENHIEEAPCVDGGTVQTLMGYNLMRNEMEHLIAQHPECRIYNSTKGGAVIEGTIYSSLSEIAENCFNGRVCTKGERFDVRETHTFDRAYAKAALETYDQAKIHCFRLLEDFLRAIQKVDGITDMGTSDQVFSELNACVLALGENAYMKSFIFGSASSHYQLLASFLPTIASCGSLPEKREMMKQRYGAYYNLIFALYLEFESFYNEMREGLLNSFEDPSLWDVAGTMEV